MDKPRKNLTIYPGTFDPLTNGHENIIRRGLCLFDEVVVGVATDTHKATLFSLEERVDMVRAVFSDEPRVKVEPFKGLLVEYASKRGISTILRGLRAVSDFEYEFQISLMNRTLRPEIETMFLLSDYHWMYISSTIVRNVACLGTDVKGLVPEHVRQCLKAKYEASL